MRFLLVFVFLFGVCSAATAERFEQQIGDWTLIQDSSDANYCYIQVTPEQFKLPEDRIHARWGHPYPRFQLAFGPKGHVIGFIGHLGIPIRGLVWLSAGGNIDFAQANGTDDGLFWYRSKKTAELVAAMKSADTLYVLEDEVPEGSTPVLEDQIYWIAISLAGFVAAEAALIERCGGDMGWNGPRWSG